MNRKFLYPLLVILIVVGINALDYFVDTSQQEEVVEAGEYPKEATNLFFIPTSTTNQIVHHEHYSLSYHEEFEQAEWVAYELKKSHLKRET